MIADKSDEQTLRPRDEIAELVEGTAAIRKFKIGRGLACLELKSGGDFCHEDI